MVVYYIVLAGITALGCCLCIKNRGWQKDAAFLGLAFIILALLSSIRYAVGYDYSFTYSAPFQRMLSDPSYSFADNRFEIGYYLLEKLTTVFSSNYQSIFVTVSVLMVGLFMLLYWQQSYHVFLSVLLFLLMGQFYCSMNFVRQTLAAVITMFAFPYLKKRKPLPYLLIVLVAACFHKSALIMIPFFFVNLIPINKFVLPVYLVLTGGAYVFSEPILSFVRTYWYSSYSMQSEHIVLGLEWPYAAFMGALFVLLFLFSKRLIKEDKSNYVYVNYAYFAFFFSLMGHKHSILDRLTLYFEMSLPIAIPLLISLLYRDYRSGDPEEPPVSRKSAAGRLAAVCAYALVGVLTFHHFMLVMDNHGVVPYRIIFNQPFYGGYVESLREDPLVPLPEESPTDTPAVVPDTSSPPAAPPALGEPKKELPIKEGALPGDGPPVAVTPEEYAAINGGA